LEKIDLMNEKPEIPQTQKPDLAASVRLARVENAERAEAIASLREIEAGRLALLESALKAVVRQAPPDVDLFDLTLSQGERPRLFLDMVAFIEMARDRRTYRFFQDTLHGRVLIAESPQTDRVVAAVTNYVARRLVEREKALAAGYVTEKPVDRPASSTHEPAAEAERPPPLPPQALLSSDNPAPTRVLAPPPARQRRGWGQRLGDALTVILMTLGSITLIALIALGGFLAWTLPLRALWTQYLGAPPF
jgi:hypothetical protein